jgi:succinate dehydrogenase (ubiquinone) cytochrome b560 subunit
MDTNNGDRLATSKAEAADILAKQRLARPVSPHLSIYKPQITCTALGSTV